MLASCFHSLCIATLRSTLVRIWLPTCSPTPSTLSFMSCLLPRDICQSVAATMRCYFSLFGHEGFFVCGCEGAAVPMTCGDFFSVGHELDVLSSSCGCNMQPSTRFAVRS